MTINEALNKSQILCSKQEKCCLDINNKLKEWNIPDDEAGKIITSLIRDNYINEDRYAEIMGREKFLFNKWGKIKIRFALKQKKLPEDSIIKALDKIDDNVYLDTLKNELLKKYRSLTGKNVAQIKNKLFRFGYSRGFEQDIIYKTINQIIENS